MPKFTAFQRFGQSVSISLGSVTIEDPVILAPMSGVTDLPFRDIVDVMLRVHAGAFSFEAGNVRHAHEWKVWQEVKLPDDRLILPGVVSHATNVVEHPELVAERICRFADVVGRERVIAGTDCGFGTFAGYGKLDPDISFKKLRAMVEGAAIASKRLWGRA